MEPAEFIVPMHDLEKAGVKPEKGNQVNLTLRDGRTIKTTITRVGDDHVIVEGDTKGR
ncbi:hypothetical protein JXB02_05095 [Candidatus Woesearchaeota archaeon]|nr:hypothetical protein [Candidatus Woesearchaeota archaeon]